MSTKYAEALLNDFIKDLEAHEEWESEPAGFRNQAGSWEDTIVRVHKILASLLAPDLNPRVTICPVCEQQMVLVDGVVDVPRLDLWTNEDGVHATPHTEGCEA